MPLFVRYKIEKEDFQKSQAKFSKACKPQAKNQARNQSLQSSLPKDPKLQNITAFFNAYFDCPTLTAEHLD